MGAVTIAPATPVSAAEDYIEVTAGCSLSEAITLANVGGPISGDCDNHNPGTTTVRITANSGTATIPGTTHVVPGVQLDPNTATGAIDGGALTILQSIKGNVTIEGDPALSNVGIFASELAPRPDPTEFWGARFFHIEPGASLTLRNLDVAGGQIAGLAPRLPFPCVTLVCYASPPTLLPPVAALGGAILARGDLTLDGVTLFGNRVLSVPDSHSAGGAVYVDGHLSVSNSLFENNQAIGDDSSLGSVASGGNALGGAIGLAPNATATISDTIFTSNAARGGSGSPGANGVDGADGTDGRDGTCDFMHQDKAYGGPGGSGDSGTHGADGADGGNAVGVIYGGAAVSIDHSSFIDNVAIAGSAGAGGVGGKGGDGGDGGDGIDCSQTIGHAGVIAWFASPGQGGNGGNNGDNGSSGNRGSAVATFDVDGTLELVNVTVAGGEATVPDDDFGTVPPGEITIVDGQVVVPDFGPITADDWATRWTRALTEVGLGGAGGTKVLECPTVLCPVLQAPSGLNGQADTTTAAEQAAKEAGDATILDPDIDDVAAVSYSTIADVRVSVPPRGHERSTTATSAFTRAAGAWRGSVLWNTDVISAPCPNMVSEGYNVFADVGGCAGAAFQDVVVGERPVMFEPVNVGAVIRPAYLAGTAPYRMPMLPPVDNGGPDAIARAPIGDCRQVGNVVAVTDDGRRAPRSTGPADVRCDSGAFESDPTGAASVRLSGPTYLYRDGPDGTVTLHLPIAPGVSTLVVTVEGLDGVAFPAGFTPTANDANPLVSEATLDFTGTEVGPIQWTFPLSPDKTAPSPLAVRATLFGTPAGTVEAIPLSIPVYYGQLNVTIDAPAQWSPCAGYLPITYVARRAVAGVPVPPTDITVTPNIVRLTPTNGLTHPVGGASGTPLAYRTTGSVTINPDGSVLWELGDIQPGAPDPKLTLYVATGGLDPAQPGFMPGDVIRASSQVTYSTAESNDIAPELVRFTEIAIGNDLDILTGLLSKVSGTPDPNVRLAPGETASLFASIDAPADSCTIPSTVPRDWTPIGLIVRDPNGATPTTPILDLVETHDVFDGVAGDEWFPLDIAAPTTPGIYYLEFEFVGPGSTSVKRLVPYTVGAAGITVSDSPDASESVATRTFDVQLSDPISDDVTFTWRTVDSTAQEGPDFTATPGTVTIPAGQTSATITVTVLNDEVLESNEEFYIELEEVPATPLPGTAQFVSTTGRAAILNDDHGLSILAGNYLEGDTGLSSVGFSIFSPVPPTADCTVGVSVVSDGTADADDVEVGSAQFTVPGGGIGVLLESLTLDDIVKGDVLDESDETFSLQLTPGTSGTPCRIHAASSSARIVDDDDATISIADVSVTEGTGSGAGGTVAVELSTPSAVDVSVDVTPAAGTATATDHSPATRVTIPAGSTSATAVVVTPDAIDEDNETFTVQLSNPAGATIGDGNATVTIADDDTATISIGDVTVTEGTGAGVTTARFTISLETPADHDVSVRADTATGTAGTGDFTATGADVVIAAGATRATVTVRIARDAVVEGDETFTLNLSRAVGSPLGDASGIATIVDDDVPTVSVGVVTMPEGDGATTVTVPITLSQASPVPITVTVTLDGCAAARDGVEVTVTIPAGATSFEVELPIAGNVTPGEDQTCTTTLTGGAGAEVDGTPGSITVMDDDPWTLAGDTRVEVSENAGAVDVTVRLNAPAPAGGITFDYATADGTAVAPGDYQVASGITTVPAGATSVMLTVKIVDDPDHEPDETFTIELSNPRRASATSENEALRAPTQAINTGDVTVGSPARVTVRDDDPAPGRLPVTGFAIARLVLLGAGALAAGLALRRGVRRRPSRRSAPPADRAL